MNMKHETLSNVVSTAILFLCTAIIPNMLTYFLQLNINMAVLSAIVSSVVLVILLLLRRNLVLSHENRALKEEPKVSKEGPESLKETYNEMKIYSINGRAWANYFEGLKIHVDRCVIFIRDNVEHLSDKDRYDKETQESIECWKDLLRKKRIETLIIYRYDHISDHYFAVLDVDVLITGLNNFNSLDSTGQTGDFPPKYIYSDDDKDAIKKHKKHFENYVQHYSANKIYDSTEQG